MRPAPRWRAIWQRPSVKSRCRRRSRKRQLMKPAAKAGGGEHHRTIATNPAAGAKNIGQPDAGSQGRASDDGERRTTAPRARRGTGACRGTFERACGNTPRDKPKPNSRERQSMKPRSRSRRLRAPSRNCDTPCSRSISGRKPYRGIWVRCGGSARQWRHCGATSMIERRSSSG